MAPKSSFLARVPVAFYLLLIFVFGAALRFSHLDWDSSLHLHPDERFMTMVADAVRLPTSAQQYFLPEFSPLSPYNTQNFQNYLYGQLPLAQTKFFGVWTGRDGYAQIHLVGRFLSAALDSLTILLSFFLARLSIPVAHLAPDAARRRANFAGLLAASLYAFCVFAIQSAHFFTADAPLAFWTTLTLLGAALLLRARGFWRATFWLFVCCFALAAAISCKIAGVFAVVAVALAVIWRWKFWQKAPRLRERFDVRRFERFALVSLAAIALTATLFRAISPTFFDSGTWLDWRPNVYLLASLQQQATYMRGEAMMPPQYQWFLTPKFIGPLVNFFGWALGPALGLAALGGVFLGLRETFGRAKTEDAARITAAICAIFFALLFVYVGSRFVHSIRYLLPVAPLCCAFAGVFLARFWGKNRRWPAIFVVGATAIYALAFVSIYARTTTRLQANEWLYANFPNGARVATEHWDDALPIGYDARNALFRGQQLEVFHEDKPEKIDQLFEILNRSDLYILSSPRAWNTIGRLPEKFPLMAVFYEKLWRGELGWEPATTITSWPQIGPLQIPTLRAEEAFYIYDHPPVTIMKPKKRLSKTEFRALFADVEFAKPNP